MKQHQEYKERVSFYELKAVVSDTEGRNNEFSFAVLQNGVKKKPQLHFWAVIFVKSPS